MKNPNLANHLVLGNSFNVLLANSKSVSDFSKLSKYSRPDNFILHFSGLSDGLLPITPVDESQGILGYGSVKINSRFFKSDITLFKNSVSDSISEISINLPLLFIDRCFNILYSKVSFIKCVVTCLAMVSLRENPRG